MAMTPLPPVGVRVTHRYDAPPESVFGAWIHPDRIAHWMFGPVVRDEQVIHLAVDARVGGTFSFRVLRHQHEIDHVGEYLEIDPPRRLVFTWGVASEAARSRVTVEIEPIGSGSALTLTHELHPDWADFAARTEEAWAAMLNALETALV
jgi:uncharacterized protein YndB with AHSA1/START domain